MVILGSLYINDSSNFEWGKKHDKWNNSLGSLTENLLKNWES